MDIYFLYFAAYMFFAYEYMWFSLKRELVTGKIKSALVCTIIWIFAPVLTPIDIVMLWIINFIKQYRAYM